MNKLGKRALSLLMSVIMLLSLLPASALAAETMPECGKEEHTHTAACYEGSGELVCDFVEGHRHTEGCYAYPGGPLVCGQVESHRHGPECYAGGDTPTCGLEEHAHTAACYPAAEESGKKTSSLGDFFSGIVDGIKGIFGGDGNASTLSLFPEDTPTVMFEFYDADGKKIDLTDKDGKPVSAYILKDGDTLEYPAAPEKVWSEGHTHDVFDHWDAFCVNSENREQKVPVTLPEGGVINETFTGMYAGQTIEMHPVYNPYWFVSFKGADDSVCYIAQVVPSEKLTANQLAEAGAAYERTKPGYKPVWDERIDLDAFVDHDITVVATSATEGVWVSFVTNGGTFVGDQQPDTSGRLDLTGIETTQKGYQFDGWYQDADLIRGPVTELTGVTRSVTLYAKWTPLMVNYTVVYWMENANWDNKYLEESQRDPQPYSSFGIETRTGRAGFTPTYDSRKLPDGGDGAGRGFSFNATKSTVNTTIAGDGTTVVNVYYDREDYSIYFKDLTCDRWWMHTHSDNCYRTDSSKTITAKYGATIASQWPTNDSGTRWKVEPDTDSNKSQNSIVTMPFGDTSFYNPHTSSGGTRSVPYYVEVLPGETGTEQDGRYKLHHTDVSKGSLNTNVSEEDRYPIPGFTLNERLSTSIGRNYAKAKFYYTRNDYQVQFVFPGYRELDRSISRKFEQSIIDGSGVYTPEMEGKVFDGWYLSEAFETSAAATLNGNMPARNITVYGRWKSETCDVTVQEADGSGQITVTVNSGVEMSMEDLIAEILEVDPGFSDKDILAFYEGGRLIRFSTTFDHNVILTVARKDQNYHLNYSEDGGEPVEDKTQSYPLNVQAPVRSPEKKSNSSGESFDYWTSNLDDNGRKYYPNDLIVVTPNTVLTAHYRKVTVDTVNLTYHANFTGANPDKVTLEAPVVNNSKINLAEVNADWVTAQEKAGFEFAGWAEKPNATSDECVKGNVIGVDNIGSNDLYAVWKLKTYTVKVEVVNGVATADGLTDDGTITVKHGANSPEITFKAGDKMALDTVTVDGEVKPRTDLINGTYTFGKVEKDHTIEVVYATDVIGGEDSQNPGDGVPDKYQVTVNYVAADNGTIEDGNKSEVLTILGTDGNWVTRGDVTTTVLAKAEATSGYKFENWTAPDEAGLTGGVCAVNPLTTMKLTGVVGKGTYTFTANFVQDVFTVVLDLNGGTYETLPEKYTQNENGTYQMTVNGDAKIEMPVKPEKVNGKFVEWRFGAENGDPFTAYHSNYSTVSRIWEGLGKPEDHIIRLVAAWNDVPLKYTIRQHYLAADGSSNGVVEIKDLETAPGTAIAQLVEGKVTENTPYPYVGLDYYYDASRTTVGNGGSLAGTLTTDDTVIDLYYDVDMWGDNGPDCEPDKNQVKVTFAVDADSFGKGQVSGTTEMTVTVGKSGPVDLTGTNVKAEPVSGNTLDIWTRDGEDRGIDPFQVWNDVKGGTKMEFFAHFDTDVKKPGEKGEEETGGDSIPDKYQATVTYKIVNGTWTEDEDDNADKKVLVTIAEKNETGRWMPINPKVEDRHIPTGMVPAADYTGRGAWEEDNDPNDEKISIVRDDLFIYTFSEKSSVKYTVEYYYDGDKATNETSYGFRQVGDTFTVDKFDMPDTTERNGVSYVLDYTENHPLTIGPDPTKNVVSIYYAKDEIGKDGGTEDGDGIPDKYQATIIYAAGANGTLRDGAENPNEILELPVVVTIRDAAGSYATSGEVQLRDVRTVADEGYAFDVWTLDTTNATMLNLPRTLNIEGGKTYTFTASFDKDEKGTDPENPEKPGDNKPDKYQAEVTYNVENGTWDGTDSLPKTVLVDLKVRDEESNNWVDANPIDRKTPTRMQANDGFKASGWDKNPATADITHEGPNVFTYTFVPMNANILTVLYVNESGTEIGSSTQPIRENAAFDVTAPNRYTYNSSNYVRTSAATQSVRYTGADQTIRFIYALDNWNAPGNSLTGGDNIPDSRQVLVTYSSSNTTYGTVNGRSFEIYTLTTQGNDGVYRGSVTLSNSAATTSLSRTYFNGWTCNRTSLASTAALSASLSVVGGSTYSVVANFGRSGGGGGTTGGGGGGGGGGTGGGTTIDDGEVPLAGDLQLNRTDHFAYIKGYTDGTVRPNNPLTRAQVATIFYRLLDETSRTIYFQETNEFSDVPESFWACKAISTLTNAEILTGFQDGSFRPNAYITRAQFAAIAARFDNVVPGLENPFSDVSEDYWARDLIAYAADRGWITGSSGKFRPLENITRVEAMDFINNVLERHVDAEGLVEGYTTFTDVPETDPNFYVVTEATNTHDWERRTEGQLMENWTELKADPVWDE